MIGTLIRHSRVHVLVLVMTGRFSGWNVQCFYTTCRRNCICNEFVELPYRSHPFFSSVFDDCQHSDLLGRCGTGWLSALAVVLLVTSGRQLFCGRGLFCEICCHIGLHHGRYISARRGVNYIGIERPIPEL